jgi:hypothetical protein
MWIRTRRSAVLWVFRHNYHSSRGGTGGIAKDSDVTLASQWRLQAEQLRPEEFNTEKAPKELLHMPLHVKVGTYPLSVALQFMRKLQHGRILALAPGEPQSGWKTALVTGGRINLGYHTTLRLLRCGLTWSFLHDTLRHRVALSPGERFCNLSPAVGGRGCGFQSSH